MSDVNYGLWYDFRNPTRWQQPRTTLARQNQVLQPTGQSRSGRPSAAASRDRVVDLQRKAISVGWMALVQGESPLCAWLCVRDCVCVAVRV